MPVPYNMRDYDASHIFAIITALEFENKRKEVEKYRGFSDSKFVDKEWLQFSKQQVIDCCPKCRNSRRTR